MVKVNTNMPQPTVPLYAPGVEPFPLRLREFLATSVPPRHGRTPGNRAWPRIKTIVPPPGRWMASTYRKTGTPVRLEHRPDGGLFLVIGDDITYQVVSQPMPRRWWHSRSIQSVSPRPLEPGHPLSRFPRPPNRYYIVDSLGNRVLMLYQTADGRVCSRHEYEAGGRTLYVSDNIKKSAREQRRLDKLFAGLPLPDRRPDIRNFRNSITKLMTYRPYRMHHRRWMRLILTTRYGWKGEQLETETTAELMNYRHRKANRARHRPQFQAHIEPLNQVRRERQAMAALRAMETPVGDRRWID
jgi:hypothetical protein